MSGVCFLLSGSLVLKWLADLTSVPMHVRIRLGDDLPGFGAELGWFDDYSVFPGNV